MLRRQAAEEDRGTGRITVAGTGAPGKCVLSFGTILLAQQQYPPARNTSGGLTQGT